MKLLIDNREPQSIIKYINAMNGLAKEKFVIEIKALDIGDYIFYDEINEKNIIIIERKSLSDLEASIKDGRYAEQSFRLNDSQTHNHNIIYLIEGNIINHRSSGFKNTLYSALFSLNYYKGFSVFNSINNVETGLIIYGFANKLLREKAKPGYYCNPSKSVPETIETIENKENTENTENYCSTIKSKKKSYVTTDNIMEIMLMQIPGISVETSKAIASRFKNMSELIDNIKKDETCLDSLKLKNSGRKIGKNCISAIKEYLV